LFEVLILKFFYIHFDSTFGDLANGVFIVIVARVFPLLQCFLLYSYYHLLPVSASAVESLWLAYFIHHFSRFFLHNQVAYWEPFPRSHFLLLYYAYILFHRFFCYF